mmetsp:Transcript_8610/g.24933  ORF Transcript_8610/g.24933 Transcript_8610/m.24933 type:complete len:255 (+) Transcript_8610:498-1262(+)
MLGRVGVSRLPVGDVKSVEVVGEAHVGLLEAIRADERVHLGALDVVHLPHGVLDLALVGLDVHNEDEGVVVLNLLHGRLRRERVLHDAELVHLGEKGAGIALLLRVELSGQGVHGLALVNRSALERQRLRLEEVRARVDARALLGVALAGLRRGLSGLALALGSHGERVLNYAKLETRQGIRAAACGNARPQPEPSPGTPSSPNAEAPNPPRPRRRPGQPPDPIAPGAPSLPLGGRAPLGPPKPEPEPEPEPQP